MKKKKILGGKSESCPHCQGIMIYLDLGGGDVVSQCKNCGLMIEGKKREDIIQVISSVDGIEVKEGRCKIKPNKMKRVKKQIHFGRGKVFNYKYISSERVIITKKGIDIYMTKDEMLDCFEILS